MRWLAGILALLLVLLASGSARAQAAKGVVATAPVPPPEEEATDSPRASMRTFLDLAERNHFAEAALYLDLPRGSEKRGPELAAKLFAVLSQRLLVRPEQLSASAQGRSTDGLPSGVEELGKIADAKGHPVQIRLVRHESKAPDDETRWVFSQTTVSHIDALYAGLDDRWIRERMPPALVMVGPLSLYYWQWLALPVLAGLALALGRVLAAASVMFARRILVEQAWSARLLTRLKNPVSIGWALAILSLVIPFLAMTMAAEDLVQRTLRALAYLTFFWGLLRAVTVLGDEMLHADWTKTRPSARGLSGVLVSLGKIIVAAFALMVALSELGYPVTSVIAGLGIGGVAIALAAQKTVENLFGSISILADQPFRVGDIIRVDTIEGTVETIGLRSTRVRTIERTLVIFPNGKLADMRIESLGPRDRIRFATKLQLARVTTPAQVERVVRAVKERLTAHASVRKEDVFVRLSAIGEASYDVDASAPIETVDAGEFARIREELLLSLIETIKNEGVTLAVPTRALVGAVPAS